MIYESLYWKEDLIKVAEKLSKREKQKRWNEKTFVSVEKDIFISFYAIRKLIEANKISTSLSNKDFSVSFFKNKGKPVTQLNWHKIEALYDFEVEIKEKINLKILCNLFIHSYVFIIDFNKDNFDGILVNSDFSKNNKLFKIPFELIIYVFKEVGKNYPANIHLKFDKKKKDYKIVSK